MNTRESYSYCLGSNFNMLRRSARGFASLGEPRVLVGVPQARTRLLESMRARLTFSDWQREEEAVAASASSAARKVLALNDGELRALAARLAAQGNKRCAYSALSARVGAEAGAVAVGWFELQYAKLLTELVQRRTDFWGAKAAIAAADCHAPSAAAAFSAAQAKELLETGLCVIDGALSADEVGAAREELQRMHTAGELGSVELQKQSNVRNDLVGWLETSVLAAKPALAPVVALLRGIPAEVERHAGWRLSVPPLVQAALYDGSAGSPSFYHRHLDCGDPSANPRRLTAILYLNPHWDTCAHGGALRAYLRNGSVRDIAPEAGRLLLFNSCEVPHEVLPAFASRMAITLWAFAAEEEAVAS